MLLQRDRSSGAVVVLAVGEDGFVRELGRVDGEGDGKTDPVALARLFAGASGLLEASLLAEEQLGYAMGVLRGVLDRAPIGERERLGAERSLAKLEAARRSIQGAIFAAEGQPLSPLARLPVPPSLTTHGAEAGLGVLPAL